MDPLAPALRIVSVLDDALDPEKFTPELQALYLAEYDPKHLAGCFREGVSPAWFCITQLKQTTLADEIDPVLAQTRRLKLAVLHCCHRVEKNDSVTWLETDASELSKKPPRVASDSWWDRLGDEFGVEMLYTIGIAILKRARVPKGKRGPLA